LEFWIGVGEGRRERRTGRRKGRGRREEDGGVDPRKRRHFVSCAGEGVRTEKEKVRRVMLKRMRRGMKRRRVV
jgi:hypothetical protein